MSFFDTVKGFLGMETEAQAEAKRRLAKALLAPREKESVETVEPTEVPASTEPTPTNPETPETAAEATKAAETVTTTETNPVVESSTTEPETTAENAEQPAETETEEVSVQDKTKENFFWCALLLNKTVDATEAEIALTRKEWESEFAPLVEMGLTSIYPPLPGTPVDAYSVTINEETKPIIEKLKGLNFDSLCIRAVEKNKPQPQPKPTKAEQMQQAQKRYASARRKK